MGLPKGVAVLLCKSALRIWRAIFRSSALLLCASLMISYVVCVSCSMSILFQEILWIVSFGAINFQVTFDFHTEIHRFWAISRSSAP
jgi:hypothetical protein